MKKLDKLAAKKIMIVTLKGLLRTIVSVDLIFAELVVYLVSVDIAIANAAGIKTPRCKLVITRGGEKRGRS